MTDDAPQFKLITETLCWDHVARNIKKLTPVNELYQNKTMEFLTTLWNFYHKLKKFHKCQSNSLKLILDGEFNMKIS